MAARKNYTAAQIINGLRRAEVGLANGKSMKEVIRDLGVSEQTFRQGCPVAPHPRAFRPPARPLFPGGPVRQSSTRGPTPARRLGRSFPS